MNTPKSAFETSDPKPTWPKISLAILIFLWLMTIEFIFWFIPAQPRWVIRNPSDDVEEPASLDLTGFSPDGKTLVTAVEPDPNEPGQIYRLWDVNTGRDLGTVGRKDKTILPNVVYVSQRDLAREIVFPIKPYIDSSYVLFDLTSRRETATIEIKREEDFESHLCFSLDGKTLAYSKYWQHKGELQLVEVATGRVRAHLKGEEYGFFHELIFSHGGDTFVTTVIKTNPDGKLTDNAKVIVLDVPTGKISRAFNYHGLWTRHAALSPDGTTLAINCRIGWGPMDHRLELWDLVTGKQKRSFKAEGFDEFLPDGKGFAVWDQDSVKFCDANTGKQFSVTKVSPATYAPGLRGLESPVPIPGTNLLAVPSGNDWKPGFFFQWCSRYLGVKNRTRQEFDSQLVFLDTRTGHKVAAIEVPDIDGAISPDGKTLALPMRKNDESTIELWDIPPRKPLRWVLGFLAIPSVVTLITLIRIRQRFFRSGDGQGVVRGTAS